MDICMDVCMKVWKYVCMIEFMGVYLNVAYMYI